MIGDRYTFRYHTISLFTQLDYDKIEQQSYLNKKSTYPVIAIMKSIMFQPWRKYENL